MQLDPYRMQAGHDLDSIVHCRVIRGPASDRCLPYSTYMTAARRALSAELRVSFGTSGDLRRDRGSGTTMVRSN